MTKKWNAPVCIAASALAALLLTACSPSSGGSNSLGSAAVPSAGETRPEMIADTYGQVQVGMTQTVVGSILGKPDRIYGAFGHPTMVYPLPNNQTVRIALTGIDDSSTVIWIKVFGDNGTALTTQP